MCIWELIIRNEVRAGDGRIVRAAQSSEKRLSIYGEDIGIMTGSREIEIHAFIQL